MFVVHFGCIVLSNIGQFKFIANYYPKHSIKPENLFFHLPFVPHHGYRFFRVIFNLIILFYLLISDVILIYNDLQLCSTY